MAQNLTGTEVEHFLEKVLQIKQPFARFKADRVALLRDIITSFLERVPFQSVTAIATPRSERRGLTFVEIKKMMLAQMGGLCCECNYFMKELLEGLGYDVHHVAFDVGESLNSHIATVMKGLVQPADHHLVDVGVGYFLKEPIPLDFIGESPVRQDNFLRNKFVRDEDGTLRWMHAERGDLFESAMTDPVQGWRVFSASDLQPRPIEFFTRSMENVHTVERGPDALTPFLTSLRAVVYRGGKLQAIKDTILLEEDAAGVVQKKRFSNQEEMLEAFRVHFPQFSLETVQQALNTLDLKFKV